MIRFLTHSAVVQYAVSIEATFAETVEFNGAKFASNTEFDGCARRSIISSRQLPMGGSPAPSALLLRRAKKKGGSGDDAVITTDERDKGDKLERLMAAYERAADGRQAGSPRPRQTDPTTLRADL
jgi:hypothetical protein